MLRREIAAQVAKEFGLSQLKVELLYKLWWKEVKNSLESNDLTQYKECNHTDINIPLIGKLVLDLRKIDKINEQIKVKRDKAAE